MRAGRLRNVIYSGTAWMLTALLLLSYAERLGCGVIDARAKEDVAEGDNDITEHRNVLSLGYHHSAAIKSDGSLWTWGGNFNGGLGIGEEDNSIGSSNKPVHVMDNVKFVSVGGNSSASAAITVDDNLWLWGGVPYMDGVDRTVPTMVMSDVKTVSVGKESAAVAVVKRDGSLWTWGFNTYGMLGNGSTEHCNKPVKIMDQVENVDLGYKHGAAIKEDGSLWMWGRNLHGGLGNGTTEDSLRPIKIMEDVKWCSLGDGFSAVIKTDGSLWMWGNNYSGQLGVGKNEQGIYENEVLKPVYVLDNVKTISLGENHCAAIKSDDSLWIWGPDTHNSLGLGDKFDWGGYGVSYIRPIKLMDHVDAVSVGHYYSAAVKSDGSLWTWGDNQYGKLGNGLSEEEQNKVSEPMQIMSAGSIAVSAAAKPEFTMNIEKQVKPRIRVLDAKGDPVAEAQIMHLNKKTATDKNGYAFLSDYRVGESISISKEGYKTLTTAFRKFKSGCTPYKLSDDLSPEVIMTMDGEIFDLLVEEVTINRHVEKHFSMTCVLDDVKYETYMLYSGDKFIAASANGVFSDLSTDKFLKNEPVYLKLQKSTSDVHKNFYKKLGIQVVDINPNIGKLSIGEDITVHIPEDVPIIGGHTVQLNLGDSPVEGEIITDGKLRLGINVAELMKKDKNWFETMKSLNEDSWAQVMSEISTLSPENKNDKKKKSPFDFSAKAAGYVEGDLRPQGRATGRIYIELSASGAWEKQQFILWVPCVVEISVEGKVNADGSITYVMSEGFTGGSLSAGGEVNVGLYGGIGGANLASIGIYGTAGLGINYIFFPADERGLDELYIQGEVGGKAKFKGSDVGSISFIDGKYIIFPENKRGWANSFAIDNNTAYAQLSRAYLQPDGTMPAWTATGYANADGSLGEVTLQSSTCLDIIPQVIRMGDTVMLFYLSDAGAGRSAADRSMLVYSLWDAAAQNWSEPKAVLDDRTADFAPDLYTDGEKIYAVWQNAEGSLEGNLTLNEIADRLVLHTAVYDAAQNQFVDLGAVESENDLCQQSPQIVADGKQLAVYWYENAQDNVLGLSGTNRIYQAVLENADSASKMAVQAAEKAETEEDPDPGAGTFMKYVALEEEEGAAADQEDQETISENNLPETDNDENAPDHDEVNEEETEDGEEAEEEDTSVSENTISENSISENTLKRVETVDDSDTDLTESPWKIHFLQEENACIISNDAGRTGGETGYAYAAGTLDGQYNVTQSRVVFLAQGQGRAVSESGTPEKVEFAPVYAGETLTWYQDGDIRYMDENNNAASLFGDGRIPSSSYTLLSDGAGSPEVIFPVNADGRSNLYRIGYENGAFLAALPVTEQEDYIQYADGFVSGGRTVLVYNRMEVNDRLEEVNNSLCTGTLEHQYYDIGMKSTGSTVRPDAETGEDVLEITAQLYNNGTITADQMSLTLAKRDGTVLETALIDTVLEAGESGYATAVFSMDNITEEAAYTLSVSGAAENNLQDNSVSVTLGGAALQVDTEIIAVGGTRTLQAGIRNSGVTACGGTVSVRDAETGDEYCSSAFEPVTAGETVYVEVEIDRTIFAQRDAVVLETVVTPDTKAGQGDAASETDGAGTVSDFVTAYAPAYAVDFVTEAEETTVYVRHGERAALPANPTKAGAHFAGWYDAQNPAEGTLYTEETAITADVTLYACFVQEEQSIPMEHCSVSEIPAQLYTGKAVKPAVTVKWGGEMLSPKTDYAVTYQNNKEQGKASATITGKGRYSGSITRTFMILYPVSKVSVSAIPAVDYNGESHTPAVEVTYQKKTLVKNKDYTLTYSNNRNAGTAGVTITGKGRYTGTKTVTFSIRGINIAGMDFQKIPNVTYSRTASRPVVTVKTKDGEQLRAGADYRLAYENTANKGTATVTVIGNGNYTGTKKLTYKVLAKPLTEKMAAEIGAVMYTGSAVKPAVKVTDGSVLLEQGRDYTVSYARNKAVGTAMATIRGKGNYTGTVKVPYEIQPVNMESNPQVQVKVNDAAYTGRAVKPAVQVYDGDRKLPSGAYTTVYSNNIQKGTAAVTVTGRAASGYTGSVTKEFRILDKAKLVTSLKIDRIADMTYTGTALEPAVSITDGDYRLMEGVDYETSYRNQYHAGKAVVTISGIGSYAGSKDVTYKINKRAIARQNVWTQGFAAAPVADMKYTGYALKPDVALTDNGRRLEQGKDYKLSYRKNTKIGTAAVTVKGIGDYNGSINTVTFRITGWDYNDLQAEIPNQVYTGKALKPQVMFSQGGETLTLKPGTAVKLVYQNHKNAGTAAVTITGKGELRDMNPITAEFEIEPADLSEAVVARIPNQTLKGVAVSPVPRVKVGRNTLKAGRDFTVSYLRNGVKGEAEVIITGIGNYTGSCRRTFIVQ